VSKLRVVYWRDIPSQIVIREGRRSTRLRLSSRFMKAIERAAYRLKKQQQDALFEPWHDVAQPCCGEARQAAQLLLQQLEQHYTDDLLETLIRASGVDETRSLNA